MTTSFPIEGGEGPAFRFGSLEPNDRQDIVLLSGDLNTPGAAYVNANTLELTALGANTDLYGLWDPPESANIDFTSWKHIASTGRDVYVKVTRRGWLFPLGHEATMVTICERVIVPDPKHDGLYAEAYVGVKLFVRPTELVKTYPLFGQPFGTNDWPFKQTKILSDSSPELDPNLVELTEVKSSKTFPLATPPAPPYPADAQALLLTYNGGQQVYWPIAFTDLAGNEMHLEVPLVFVFGSDAASGYQPEFQHLVSQPWVNAYNNMLPTSGKLIQGNGQKLRFSPEAGGPAGGTTHPVVSITLGAASPTGDPNTPTTPPSIASDGSLLSAGQPAFYPVIASSNVRIKAADALSNNPNGFSDSSGSGVGIQYYPDYVVQGLPEGDPPSVPLNGLYAEMTDAVTGTAGPLMQFPSNLVGGLGTPNLLMAGMSAISGPVGGALSGLSDFASGLANPSQYFTSLVNEVTSALPQLFGALNLGDILGSFTNDLPGGIPNMTTSFDQDTGTLTVSYTLTANLQNFPDSDPVFAPKGGSGNFTLKATATLAANKAPTYDVEGSIDPFDIYLVSQNTAAFIDVPFNGFTFSAKTGGKTHVDPSVGEVTFIGALSFVNTLEQFLQDLGGSGLSISITPTEVDASFGISLPTIAVGVFSLSGIAFSAGVKVPFLGDPALVTFGFASQDNPFTLTICMFGGGGFLALGLGFHGVQTVQASFEFEGQFSLDLGVASGGISLSAGVYYSYVASGPSQGTTLTGFVKLVGEVEVLGIISVSIELDLTLTYVENPQGHYVQGTATLKLSISILFFSITVPITVTKQFAGGGSSTQADQLRELEHANVHAHLNPNPFTPVTPITFEDVVPTRSVWAEYCDAFAN